MTLSETRKQSTKKREREREDQIGTKAEITETKGWKKLERLSDPN